MFPFGANANLFSFVTDLFAGSQENASESWPNSQNIALLQAPLNTNPSSISGGGDITIVENTALLADGSVTGGWSDNKKDHPTSDQISIYVVREGDSLSQIAQMFDVSVNTIRWSNDISGSTISPGQTLVILPISGVRHTVAKDETLEGIAKKYKGNFEEILQYNNLTSSSKLAVGDIIVIPDGEILAESSGSSAPRTRVVAATKEYVGYYLKPVSGVRTQNLHGYNAVDIGAPTGTTVVASAPGTVLISRPSGWNGGYGNYIVIAHPNGTQTLYAHLSSNIVSTGTRVVQGQVIGYVGATGKSTGPHLHFEVRGAKNPF